MKKLFYLGIVIILISLVSCQDTNKEKSTEKTDPFEMLTGEKPADLFVDGNEAYNKMLQAWEIQFRSTPGGKLYADYFGGAYLDSNGKMHVLVTTDDLKTREDLKRVSGKSDLMIHKCKYSLNYLKSLMDSIDNYIIHNQGDPLAENILVWTIRERDNDIKVTLDTCDENRVNEFKTKISDSPVFFFTPKVQTTNPESHSIEVKFVDSPPVISRAATKPPSCTSKTPLCSFPISIPSLALIL